MLLALRRIPKNYQVFVQLFRVNNITNKKFTKQFCKLGHVTDAPKQTCVCFTQSIFTKREFTQVIVELRKRSHSYHHGSTLKLRKLVAQLSKKIDQLIQPSGSQSAGRNPNKGGEGSTWLAQRRDMYFQRYFCFSVYICSIGQLSTFQALDKKGDS